MVLFYCNYVIYNNEILNISKLFGQTPFLILSNSVFSVSVVQSYKKSVLLFINNLMSVNDNTGFIIISLNSCWTCFVMDS